MRPNPSCYCSIENLSKTKIPLKHYMAVYIKNSTKGFKVPPLPPLIQFYIKRQWWSIPRMQQLQVEQWCTYRGPCLIECLTIFKQLQCRHSFSVKKVYLFSSYTAFIVTFSEIISFSAYWVVSFLDNSVCVSYIKFNLKNWFDTFASHYLLDASQWLHQDSTVKNNCIGIINFYSS